MKLHDRLEQIADQTSKQVQRGHTECTSSTTTISLSPIEPGKATVKVSVQMDDGSTPRFSYMLNANELKVNIESQFSGTAYIDWEIAE